MEARERRTEITQDRVLNEIAKMAFADMKKFLAYRTEITEVATADDGTPILGY